MRGGRPRRRFSATGTPSTKISPPQTPHGSSRSMAAARHCVRATQGEQIALARAMSSGSSEKNSEV